MEFFGTPIDTWINWAPGIIAVLSFSGVAIVYIKRKIVAWFLKIQNVIETFKNHTKSIADVADKIDIVLAEVTHNGGSSLKDVVRRIEHRLYDLEFTSLTILDHEQVAVFKTNPLGQCVWVNRACARLFDQSREEILNYGWISSIVNEQRAGVTEEWARAVKDQREVILEYSIRHLTGEIIPVEVKAYPILGPNSAFLGYVGNVIRKKPPEAIANDN